ncbi:MAG: hypothetical protein IJQ36_09200 [Oscillospiraceae bacterium]|nr:hypothetical protein [Oscillospiraceae bacterium]
MADGTAVDVVDGAVVGVVEGAAVGVADGAAVGVADGVGVGTAALFPQPASTATDKTAAVIRINTLLLFKFFIKFSLSFCSFIARAGPPA